MKFTIGKAGDADLRGDLDPLIYSRLLVQANSGGGKSWAVRRLLEQTHGHVQHLVIDPEGEFSTLRERFDYVLAARQGGDTVADPRAARLLAERLLELQVSAVLDIYELKAHERVRFVRLFLEALIEAPKKLWRPALVVVDEAHVFCPQKGEAESASAVIDLATRGRKRGFCAILATQRLSKLHKDAAAECNNKLIGRSALDVDMDRAADELGFTGKDEKRKLRELREGEFYAFGPAFTRQVTLVKVGPVQTTHPRAGGRLSFTPPPPTEKVKALLPKLADLPAEEEKRRVSETELKRRIAELERELRGRSSTKAAVTAPVIRKVEVLILRDAQVKRLEVAVDRARDAAATLLKRHAQQVDQLSQRLQVVVSEAGLLQDQIKAATRAVANQPGRSATAAPTAVPRLASPPRAAETRPAPRREPGDGVIGAGERRILVAIAQHQDGVSREQLTVLTGYKRSSRDTYLQRLRAGGFVTDNGDSIEVTNGGLDELGPDFKPLPTGEALRDYWMAKLPEGERKILGELSAAYPHAIARDDLDEPTGYKRSSRDTYLQRLRSRRLVDDVGRGQVRASRQLFEGA